jgi:uncharacterized membrane protein HdeD (DUF308 family)
MSALLGSSGQAGQLPPREKRTLLLVLTGCVALTAVLIALPPRSQRLGLSVLVFVGLLVATIANGARAMRARKEGHTLLGILLGILSLLCFALSFAGFGWVCNSVELPA